MENVITLLFGVIIGIAATIIVIGILLWISSIGDDYPDPSMYD